MIPASNRLKRLRKRAEKLSYRVQIAEQRARLAELHSSSPLGFYQRKEASIMGFPSKGTKADQRLKENQSKSKGKGSNRPATPPGQVRKAGK